MTNTEYGQLRAFPVPGAQGEGGNGLTKREWFAGMAMQAIIPHAEATKGESDVLSKACAIAALIYADAMIAALNPNPKE